VIGQISGASVVQGDGEKVCAAGEKVAPILNHAVTVVMCVVCACSPDEAQRNPGMFEPGVAFAHSARVTPDWHPGYSAEHPCGR